MTDKQLRALLEAIQRLALMPYPFPAGEEHDPHLLMGLGEIAGIATRALKGDS